MGTLRVALYGFGDRRRMQILIPLVAKRKILFTSMGVSEVIGRVRAQEGVDGKPEFPAQAWNL